MQKKVEIYVSTHKVFNMPVTSDEYIPILNGSALTPLIDCDYQKDDVGENISIKKERYNELVAMYWAWKNSKADVKGLCHYRRFLYKKNVTVNPAYLIRKEDIINDLNMYDCILPVQFNYKQYTVEEAYSLSGKGLESDLEITKEVIRKKYPEYMEDFDNVMLSHSASLCNIIIAPCNIFDSYSEWLFSILFEVEKKIDFSTRSGQQIRALGFLGERLLNVWVKHNKLKIKYYYANMTDIQKNYKYYIKVFLENIKL